MFSFQREWRKGPFFCFVLLLSHLPPPPLDLSSLAKKHKKTPQQLGMMASFLLAYKVDSAVSRQQRRDLGLCEACGGLNEKESCRERGCPMK